MREFLAEFNFVKREKEELYFHVENKEPLEFSFFTCKTEPIQFNISSDFVLDTSN